MAQQTHIIGRQVLEVEIGPHDDQHQVQQDVRWIYQNQILPRLEMVFDRLVEPNIIIQLDKLEIDVGEIQPGKLNTVLVDKVIKESEDVLRRHVQQMRRTNQVISVEQNTYQAFIHFLTYGRFSWLNAISGWHEFEALLIRALQSDGISVQLKPFLKNNNRAIKRLTRQFSEEVIHAVVQSIGVQGVEKVSSGLQVMVSATVATVASLASRQISRVYWEMIITRWLRGDLSQSKIDQLGKLPSTILVLHIERVIDRYAKDGKSLLDERQLIVDVLEAVAPANKSAVEIEEIELQLKDESLVSLGIPVNNAGLVLLHPFLKPFFDKLNLVQDGNFVSDTACERAVHVLQFLATGTAGAPESELLLNKVLCGIDVDVAIEREVTLSGEEEAESMQLLDAVLGHWEVLKGTSPAGLRNSFLMREGRLKQGVDDWHLQVEKKTLDILLDRLPWGIGMIKLPWMDGFLHVNWT